MAIGYRVLGNFRFTPWSSSLVQKFAVILFCFVLCVPSRAGNVCAISGRVMDPTGAVIAGATVLLRNVEIAAQHSGTTDGEGAYKMAAPAGHYQIEIRASGFKPYLTDSLDCGGALDLQLDATLALSSQTTTVEVSASSLQIDLSSTQMGETIAEQKIAEVPLNGRSFTDLLAIQAGVVPASSQQPNAVVMAGAASTPCGSPKFRSAMISTVSTNEAKRPSDIQVSCFGSCWVCSGDFSILDVICCWRIWPCANSS